MIYQLLDYQALFNAVSYDHYNDPKIKDLMEQGESIEQFKDRVGITLPVTELTPCIPIKLTKVDREYFYALRDSIHVVESIPHVGFIQDLEDSRARVFLSVDDEYYHFDLRYRDTYKAVKQVSKMFDKYISIVQQYLFQIKGK